MTTTSLQIATLREHGRILREYIERIDCLSARRRHLDKKAPGYRTRLATIRALHRRYGEEAVQRISALPM